MALCKEEGRIDKEVNKEEGGMKRAKSRTQASWTRKYTSACMIIGLGTPVCPMMEPRESAGALIGTLLGICQPRRSALSHQYIDQSLDTPAH